MIEARFPPKLKGMFAPNRYKVAYGGRGSGKSWAFARALLILAAKQPMRILCTREVQKSIKDSVHKLLSDQIQGLGLGPFFEVLETTIRGLNGSEIIFAGLASHTVESVKSYEGCDIVWVEEAQTVSKKSWDILIPTIRKPGSEIWVTLNPVLDTDETYVRFIVNRQPGDYVVKINWSDNPWLPDVLDAERRRCLTTQPKDYPNIWEGECKPAADGAIYADEVAAAIENGRVTNVPYDPLLKVHVVFDLGWNDAMSISLVQRNGSEIRVLRNIEDSHRTLDSYSQELRALNLNWGLAWLPHDARHRDFKTGKSTEEIMRAFGWDVRIIPQQSVEDGIRQARMTLPRTFFDKTHADRLVQCLKRYRRGINTVTNEPGAPLHDEFSHGADNYRYIATVADQMSNEDWGGTLNYPQMSFA
jgi:phage terminase large subunit